MKEYLGFNYQRCHRTGMWYVWQPGSDLFLNPDSFVLHRTKCYIETELRVIRAIERYFSFPSNPLVGHQHSYEGQTYIWDGDSWLILEVIPSNVLVSGEILSKSL